MSSFHSYVTGCLSLRDVKTHLCACAHGHVMYRVYLVLLYVYVFRADHLRLEDLTGVSSLKEASFSLSSCRRPPPRPPGRR